MLFSFWEVLLLFAAFQGFYISYLIWVQPKENVNKWLISLVLIISLLLIDYVFYISELQKAFPHLQHVMSSFWFLLGPLYYFFILSYLDKPSRVSFYFHLLPAIITFCQLIPFYLLPTEIKQSLFTPLSEINYDDLTFSWIYYALHFSIYLFFSAKLIFSSQKNAKEELSNSSIDLLQFPLKITYILCFYILSYFLVAPLLAYQSNYFIEIDYLNILLLAILNHTIAIFTIKFSIPKLPKIKYETSSLSVDDLSYIKEKVINIIESEKLFLIPDLKIQDLSEKTSIPKHQISQMFSQKLNKRFYDFINMYRVSEIKKRLNQNEYKQQTIISLAFDVGFNSQASFYRIFKRIEGKTPTQYINSLS